MCWANLRVPSRNARASGRKPRPARPRRGGSAVQSGQNENSPWGGARLGYAGSTGSASRADAQTRAMPALEADIEFSYTLPNGDELTRRGRIYRSASGKVRQDIGNGSMITDLQAGTITMLIPDTKEAHVLAVPPELRLPPQLGVGNPVPARVQPFEETTIDGRRVAKTLTVDSQGRTQEVWTAIDLGVVTFARVEADGVATRQ